MARWSPDNLPEELPRGGKMGSCGLDHGHLPEHPLKMGEDHRKVIWLLNSRGTCSVRQRDKHSIPIDAGG